jgi:hypothetical protein
MRLRPTSREAEPNPPSRLRAQLPRAGVPLESALAGSQGPPALAAPHALTAPDLPSRITNAGCVKLNGCLPAGSPHEG